MATQTIAFNTTSGQTLTAKLLTIGTDTVIQTASSVTAGINDISLYLAVFTDVPAGDYRLLALNGTTPAFIDNVTLTLTTATFVTWGADIVTSTSGIHVSSLSSEAVEDIFSTFTITESYAADGSNPTAAQALWLIQQTLSEFTISGTTITVKKKDGSTTAATFTMDSATSPRSRTRAS